MHANETASSWLVFIHERRLEDSAHTMAVLPDACTRRYYMHAFVQQHMTAAQQHGLVLEKDRHATNKQNMHARIGHNMPASTIDTICMPPFTQHAFLVVSSFGSLGAAAGLNISRTRNTSL